MTRALIVTGFVLAALMATAAILAVVLVLVPAVDAATHSPGQLVHVYRPAPERQAGS